jgi:hypothetical protein
MKSLTSILPFMGLLVLTCLFAGMRTCKAAETGKGVEFYLLEDEKMHYGLARDIPLKDLKLRPAPWIAADNIERYDWSSHYVYLKKPVDIPNEEGRKYVNLGGKPFVITADGRPCYLGTLRSGVSSSLPRGSVVAMVTVFGDNIERFPISLFSMSEKVEATMDSRNNPVLKETLKRDGLFHAGLECTLDGITAERNGKSLTIVYTYTLRNNDQDDLYVLDPQKFHPALFHDYRNGVTAQDLDHGQYNFISWPNPRNGEPKYSTNRELSWYARLEKGKTMTRSVTMDLTPKVPPEPGKYQFVFRFKGDTPAFSYLEDGSGNDNNQLLLKNNAAATDPKAADGRIWLGQISAEITQNVK